MALLPIFLVLLVASLSRERTRVASRSRRRADWYIDLSGLAVQGTVIPLLQVTWVATMWAAVLPEVRGAVELPAVLAFLLCFVGTDLLYYANHRWLHGPGWSLHQVHHEAVAMDVLSTSRNTLWTSLFIVYLWVDALWLVVLADPWPYAAAMFAGSALDLWRHSDLDPPASLAAWLRPWLVLPSDHARHHGADAPAGNFGANLKLWDWAFGTRIPEGPQLPLGRPTGLPWLRALLWPWA